MDPLSAIGLASNILQFLEYGINICKGAHEVAASATGLTAENAHTSLVVDDLKQAINGLAVNTHGTSTHERELAKLAGNCRDVSGELTEILSKLKARKGERLWGNIRTAWRSSFKRKEIAALEKRLEDYRAQIVLRLNLLLYEEQSPVKGYLKQIQQQATDLGNKHGTQMQIQSDQLQKVLHQLSVLQASNSDLEAIRIATTDIRLSLGTLQLRASQVPRENETLRALYFPSMFQRNDTIQSAVGDTYRWLVREDDLSMHFNGPPPSGQGLNPATGIRRDEEAARRSVATHFRDFLLRGDGIFFIYGKAGSGKSTLMRFIANNSVVRKHLHSWSAGRRLIFVSVYFWAAGDPLQRSLEGLYRSILYQTLGECPELMTNAFEHGPTRVSWEQIRLPLLKQAVMRLMHMLDSQRYNLCLIIDGLDEYEGDGHDHTALVEDIQSWTRKNIKIICSARPHPEYMQMFTNEERTIRLHCLTKADIWEYTMDMFSRHASPDTDSTSLSSLADRVVSDAEGVFLWAYLVVRSLTRKMRIFSVAQLSEMLRATPRDLNKLFDQMLDKVDPLTQKYTENFLLLVLRDPFRRGLNALSFSWMEDLENPSFPFQNPMCAYSAAEIERRLQLVRSRIGELTGGMLEIRERVSEPYCGLFFRHTVRFFHRTFHEYLKERWHNKDGPTVETYIRISLAEIKFSYSMDLYNHKRESRGSLVGFVWIWSVIVDSFKASRPGVEEALAQSTIYFEELERLINGYEALLDSSAMRSSGNSLRDSPVIEPEFMYLWGQHKWLSLLIDEENPKHHLGVRPFSFLNFLAAQGNIRGSSNYLVRRLRQHTKRATKDSRISMVHILIHSTLQNGQAAVSSFCLKNGVTWQTPVAVWQDWVFTHHFYPILVPAWLVLLGLMVYHESRQQYTIDRFGDKLEQLLKAEVDLTSVVLSVSFSRSPFSQTPQSTRVVDLRDLVEIVLPKNVTTLMGLFDQCTSTQPDTSGTVATVSSGPEGEKDYAAELRAKYRRPALSEIHEYRAGEVCPRLPHVLALATPTQVLSRSFKIQSF